MVIVPSQGLKLDALIRRGLTEMKIWNVIVFIDPQIKSAHSGYQDQAQIEDIFFITFDFCQEKVVD